MTALAASPAAPARPVMATVVAAGLVGLFVARPLLNRVGNPTGPLVVLFTLLLVVGLGWPLATRGPGAALGLTAAVAAAGVAAFVLGRLIGGGHAPAPSTLRVLALNTLAAVAEEAFFRRLVFAVLLPGGVLLACLGSAGLFAVAHVTVYGWWVLPLDLAAGLVLSWQRAATGSWKVPALTHVIANLLVVA